MGSLLPAPGLAQAPTTSDSQGVAPNAQPVRKRQTLPFGGGPTPAFTAEQRLLVLDVWKRSGLPAGDFCPLVGVAAATLYEWKRRFEEDGPAGLTDQPRGPKPGSRLPEATKRAILMMREAHGDWGCQRISDMLLRGPALHASPEAVARVLRETGIELEEPASRPHAQPEHSFERAKPNQLWQTDLFTFMLKSQNRRAYMVAFMDDHSRFIVSYGLHLSQSTPLVIEALRAGIANYGPPEEVKRTLASRVAANALTLAKNGLPKEPFYVTGQAGGRAFTLHAEGERVYLTDEKGARREIDLVPPDPKPLAVLPAPLCPEGSPAGDPAAERNAPPGTSPLDAAFGLVSGGSTDAAGQLRGGSLDDVMRRLKEEGRS